jgi:2-hydroxy-3-keto-5-methylthiopentenyl-1-phosphate phosphatase
VIISTSSLAPPTTVILDFDGTVTCADVGDEICERFADARWREIDLLWEEKRISLPEAQEGMWGLVKGAPAEILAYACEVGQIRPGLDDLLDVCLRSELVLASGGFDFYIEAILGPRLERFGAVYSNRGVFAGAGVTVTFPHRGALGCPLCAVCKGRIAEDRRAAGRRVVFIGDGPSDRCAIGRADLLFAVRGSKLARACQAEGAPAVEFDTLDEVARQLFAS